MKITKGIYKIVGFFLFILSIVLMYINIIKLGVKDLLLIFLMILPLIMAIIYFLVGLDKFHRNNLIDISLYIILALILLGLINLNSVTLIIIPLFVLLVGLFASFFSKKNS